MSQTDFAAAWRTARRLFDQYGLSFVRVQDETLVVIGHGVRPTAAGRFCLVIHCVPPRWAYAHGYRVRPNPNPPELPPDYSGFPIAVSRFAGGTR